MRIRTIAVALGLALVVGLTALLAGLGQNTAVGTGSTTLFGDGSDGPVTFSTSAQFDPPADAVVDSGSVGGTTLTASGVTGTFMAGDKILIHQTRGTGAGTWELNTVQSYALGNIVTVTPLDESYMTSGADAAQVLVIPQYTNVTVDSGVTLTAKPWNGSVGGILAFLSNGTVQIDGTIEANGVDSSSSSGATGGTGFSGGISTTSTSTPATQAEGTDGPGGAASTSANGNGAGGGASTASGAASGSGGGHAVSGAQGYTSPVGGIPSTPGGPAGTPDLSTMVFGGGGGGGRGDSLDYGGGSGGGVVAILASTLNLSGSMLANGGSNGRAPCSPSNSAALGGGGAGGSVLIRGQSLTLGTRVISATGGSGACRLGDAGSGNGAVGRIRVEYCGAPPTGGTADPLPASRRFPVMRSQRMASSPSRTSSRTRCPRRAST